ncbi:MAG: hypothetical protein AB7P04_01215 [Bacteriovoracia bacterium]
MKKAGFIYVAISSFAIAHAAYAHTQEHESFLPENTLGVDEPFNFLSNMPTAQFNEIIDITVNRWKPLATAYGGQVNVDYKWDSTEVNAYAGRSSSTWTVQFHGGLARRAEITPDGFQLVVCHELGHLFGGAPFKNTLNYMTSEGQADYFATFVCLREMWKNESAKNAEAREQLKAEEVAACDQRWEQENDRHLCYRTLAASNSVALLFSVLEGRGVPSVLTPSTSVTDVTQMQHPPAQCRLDTYFNASTCPMGYDIRKIPGYKEPSAAMQAKAMQETSCMADSDVHAYAARPRCWFAK